MVPKNAANFNVDNVRVVKIAGGGAHDSRVVKGVVIKRGTEGSIKDVTDAKVAVFAQGVDTSSTETKVPTSTPSHCLCKGPFLLKTEPLKILDLLADVPDEQAVVAVVGGQR